MKQIRPLDEQAELPNFIEKYPGEHDEQVPMDVLFVGAGPAGLSGAIELARLVKEGNEKGDGLGEIEIGVLEKADTLGGHCLSGAVINPIALKELFPDMAESDFPFKQKVKGDRVYFMTEKGNTRIPTPPTMHNDGNYTTSICEVVKWMGEKAEEAGVNVFNSFPAESLLVEGDRVRGVRTTQMGLNRDGSPGGQHMPGTEVSAQVTVLSDGTRSALAQSYMKWQKITSKRPQIYALGVKELWRTKKVPEHVTHGLGFPLPLDCFGGSWMYPMGDDLVSIGLVAGLDYKDHNLDVHKLLQKMKKHPLFAQYLEGGECIEWGAKTIPEGGYEALPDRLHGDGLVMIGDAAGMVNVPALKGIHYAMKSGILAARNIYKALKQKDTSSDALRSYDEDIKNSFIKKDLYKVRNMRHAFKSGFYSGGFKAALMTATGGAFPNLSGHFEEDAADKKNFNEGYKNYEEGLSKVDAVYLSGNKTRDDIPQHLTVGKDISPEMADMYTHLCPAGVYERKGDQLIVNAPNCIDCKATDVIGPRWQPREGGSGPDYKQM